MARSAQGVQCCTLQDAPQPHWLVNAIDDAAQKDLVSLLKSIVSHSHIRVGAHRGGGGVPQATNTCLFQKAFTV